MERARLSSNPSGWIIELELKAVVFDSLAPVGHASERSKIVVETATG